LQRPCKAARKRILLLSRVNDLPGCQFFFNDPLTSMDVTLPAQIADPCDGVSPINASWLDAEAPALTGIDSHAHIFERGLPLAANRRHAPDYDATLDAYIEQLSRHGMSQGVLVQPSFLGIDNSYLASVTLRYPNRFRGVAVVDPHISDTDLDALARANIVGARLNLLGLPLPDFNDTAWSTLLSRLNALRWHVEVQSRSEDLPALLDGLLAHGCTVVVDHFGRPDLSKGIENKGFQYLLSKASTGKVWVKLSAAYRSAGGNDGTQRAFMLAAALVDAFSAERLVWGSDWPHTEHRHVIDYSAAANALSTWIPDDATRHSILTTSPAKLFKF
jgi:predicted TIM-barrel fold metal-dependent hydrolase